MTLQKPHFLDATHLAGGYDAYRVGNTGVRGRNSKMHDASRAAGQSRSRTSQPTSEDWHEFRRFVAAARAASAGRTSQPANGSGDRSD